MNSWTRKENSHHYSTEIFTLVVNDITLNRQLWFPNNSWKWWIRLKDLKVGWLLARIWSNHRNFLALLKGQLTANKVGVSANIISKGCWQNRRNKGSNFKNNLGNEVTTGKLHLNSRVKSLIYLKFSVVFVFTKKSLFFPLFVFISQFFSCRASGLAGGSAESKQT